MVIRPGTTKLIWSTIVGRRGHDRPYSVRRRLVPISGPGERITGTGPRFATRHFLNSTVMVLEAMGPDQGKPLRRCHSSHAASN